MSLATRLKRIRDFDLLATINQKIAAFAGVPPQTSFGTKVWAILSDPRKLLILVAVVIGFSVIVVFLLVSGVLADVYRAIYEFWPGRPWTDVMRERPWIYLILALALAWLPFTLSPPSRWGRAFLSYVVFWIGFLGGHVFW